ncbi:BQ2448_1525 [Microbotryum intermedium]|uniref:Phytoene desaturase n=1 Tax=Microbotryum intermedium TaxID=269621 RepID=A0A238FDD3_9BASI|nr:BQ2448_1525 [Microbotryum intermedium]
MVSSEESTRRQRAAIVIGAGVGGVATAARLASAGYAVTCIEQNSFTGGRCSLMYTDDGYRFDQGPSLLLLPKMFEETFVDLGTTMEREGIQLVKCNPNYKVHFGDGESFTLSSDLVQMKTEVERFEGEKGFQGFLKFMLEGHQHYELSVEHVLHKNFTSLLSMLRPSFLKKFLILHPFESIYSRASRYFKTDRLRRGMSPYDSLGTYSLLQYTEMAEGIWYPIGGFHKVVEAIQKIAERRGARFRLSTRVSRVLLDPNNAKKATGVVLETGEELKADVIVINSDLIWALNNLFEPTSYAKRLAKKPVSCSSISFYWSMDRKVPELGSHNIFLADEYKESFDSIFRDHRIPHDPSFYVNVPSRSDPSAAPSDRDSIIILVPVGHISDSLPAAADWDKIVESARTLIIFTIAQRINVPNFGSYIQSEIVNTPVTWRDKFNLHRGSILGLSHSFFNVLCFRPATRHPSVDRAYFVGASAHPGTGVPICLAGARITTEQILKDDHVEIPWSERPSAIAQPAWDIQGEVKILDKRSRCNLENVLYWFFGVSMIVIAQLAWISSTTSLRLSV